MEEHLGPQQGAEALQFVDELQQDISSFLLLKGSEGDILDHLGGVLCYVRPQDTDNYRWSDALMDGLLRHPAKKSAPGNDSSGQNRSARPVFGAPPHSSTVHWPPRPCDHRRKTSRPQPYNSFTIASSSRSSAAVSAKSESTGTEIEVVGTNLEQASEAAAQAAHAVAVTAAAAAERTYSRATSKGKKAYYRLDSLLEFTSCFESANLRYAVFQPDEEVATYDLVLDNDVNTRGHTQWFYFAVRGGCRGQRVRLRILNMSKSQSLFRRGMKPVAWSEAQAAADEVAWSNAAEETCDPLTEGWRHNAENVTYQRSKLGGGSYYTLSFEYTFGENDTVYMAYCVPYTYSMNCTLLKAMERHPVRGKWCRRKRLCCTLGSLNCDVFCISNWDVSRHEKKSVVVSARVHPGESNASWLVHGLLCFLLSHSAEAQVLRDSFIWHVVPMLNPDGVVHGNYRCSLAGVDLNRQWRHPMKVLHQNVYEMKKLIKKLKEKSDLSMFIDLHGHSRKCGIFSYCCAGFPAGDERHYQVRMYPRLLSLLSPEFAFKNCRWKQGPGKRGTGRVVVAKDIGLVTSYTIEASFFGASMQVETEVDPPEEEEYSDCEDGADEGVGEESQSQGSTAATSADCGAESRPTNPTVKKGSAQETGKVVLFTPVKLQRLGADLARALLLQHNLGHEVWKINKAHELWEARFGSSVSEEEARGKTSHERPCSSPTPTGAPSRNSGGSSSGENSRQPTPELAGLSGESGDESASVTEAEVEDVEVDDGSGSDEDSCDEGAAAAEDPAMDFEYEVEGASPLVSPDVRPSPMGLPVQCGKRESRPSTAAASSPPTFAQLSAPANSTEVMPGTRSESLGPRNLKSAPAPKKKPKKKDSVRRPIQPDEWLRSPVSCIFDTLGRYCGGCGCQACASGLELLDVPADLIPKPSPLLGIDANSVLDDLHAAGLPQEDNGSTSGSDSAPSDDNLSKEQLARIGRRLVQRSRRMRRNPEPKQTRRASSTLKKNLKKEEATKRKSDGGSRRVKLERRNSDASCRSAQDLKRLVAFGQTTYVPSAQAEGPPEISRKDATALKYHLAPHMEESPSLTVVKALPECRTAMYPRGNGAISRNLLSAAENVTCNVTNLLLGSPKERFAFLGEEQKITARLGNRLVNDGTGPALAGMLCIRSANNQLLPAHRQDTQKMSPRDSAASSSSQASIVRILGPAKERFNCIARHEGASAASGSKDHHGPRVDHAGHALIQPGDFNSKESQAAVRNGKRRAPSANKNGRSDIQLPSLSDALQRELARRERVFEEVRQPRSGSGTRRSMGRSSSESRPASGGYQRAPLGHDSDTSVTLQRHDRGQGVRRRESSRGAGGSVLKDSAAIAHEISPRGRIRRGLERDLSAATQRGLEALARNDNWHPTSQRACHV